MVFRCMVHGWNGCPNQRATANEGRTRTGGICGPIYERGKSPENLYSQQFEKGSGEMVGEGGHPQWLPVQEPVRRSDFSTEDGAPAQGLCRAVRH